MSLLEAEHRRSQRARRKHRKQAKRKKKRSALEAPLPLLLCKERLQDQQVLSFRQWCSLNGFSERTGRRILNGESGHPPLVTMLTDTRIGITVANNRRWQESRARGVDRPSGDRARRGQVRGRS
jgi:hypothetical protein